MASSPFCDFFSLFHWVQGSPLPRAAQAIIPRIVSPSPPFLYSFGMARREKSGIISWLLDRMSDWAVGLLTKPLKRYSLQIPNDIAALKRHIRKGDVILVEGTSVSANASSI